MSCLLFSVFAWRNQPGPRNIFVVKWERSQDRMFVIADAKRPERIYQGLKDAY